MREHVWWFGGGGATLDLRRDMMIYRPIPRTKEDIRDVSHDRRSHWEDTAFFVGVLLLTAGGGLVVLAGLELPLAYAKLVWGGVGCVWGSVLIRVWIFNETRGR